MAVPADQFGSAAVEIRAVLKPGYGDILTPPVHFIKTLVQSDR